MPDTDNSFKGFVADRLAIAHVCRQALSAATEQIAIHPRPPMLQRQRSDLRGAQRKRLLNHMREGAHVSRPSVFAVESEKKGALQIAHCLQRRVDRQVAPVMAVRAQVIEAHDVIRVGMRVNHGVQPPHVLTQCLRAEVWAGIDDPGAFRRLHIDRGARALVPGIGGFAYPAIAANHRHAL